MPEVLFTAERVNDAAGSEEEQGLEERVSDNVPDTEAERSDTAGKATTAVNCDLSNSSRKIS